MKTGRLPLGVFVLIKQPKKIKWKTPYNLVFYIKYIIQGLGRQPVPSHIERLPVTPASSKFWTQLSKPQTTMLHDRKYHRRNDTGIAETATAGNRQRPASCNENTTPPTNRLKRERCRPLYQQDFVLN